MAKQDFAVGLLKGLYEGGLGNPEVAAKNRELSINEAYKNAEIAKTMGEAGMVPDVHPPDHPVRQKIGNFITSMFGGAPASGLTTAWKPDTSQPTATVDANGTTALVPPGQPIPKGQYKVPFKEGYAKLSQQRPKDYLSKTTWETATPEQQNLAKGMYEGRIQPSSLSYRDRGTVTALANEYGIKNNLPPFKSYRSDVAAGTAKSFATGKFGQNANALNTAIGHVGSVYDAFAGLGNTDVKFLNTPLNKLKEATNDPQVVKASLALNALRGEMATVFKGSPGTDPEIASWKEFLNRDLTPAQVNGALPEIDDLLRSRLSALEYQRSSGLSGGNNPLLSPQAEKTRARVRGGSNTMSPSPNTKTINGKTYIQQNGKWFEQ